MVVGVDLGAAQLHCVALDDAGDNIEVALFSASDLQGFGRWVAGSGTIAIDAPAQLSTAMHRDDQSINSKFRVARCAEIALGREYRCWVPWVTPMTEPVADWMRVGLLLHELAADRAIEIFPYAGFRVMSDQVLPKKGTYTGTLARVRLLEAAGVRVSNLEMWSHDGLDALLAAVVARDHARGTARRVSCGHDDSAIWLPAPLDPRNDLTPKVEGAKPVSNGETVP